MNCVNMKNCETGGVIDDHCGSLTSQGVTALEISHIYIVTHPVMSQRNLTSLVPAAI